MGRKEALEQRLGIEGAASGDQLQNLGQPREQQQDEGDRGQNGVEGERAGQKGDAVFIGGLQRPPGKPPE